MSSTMPASRTCRLATLGCKVNQYETQYVKEALEANGYVEARGDSAADLCVVNTCTVTMEGDAKSRQLIRRLHQANPDAALVVMGCYATRDPAAVGRLPGVTRVITDKNRLAEELREFGVEHLPRGITRFDGHQRAFVKVQDGCLLNCTFCIIPKVRPVVRSRPADEIADEVAGLAANGCREIVLTGIHLGHYGIDLSRGKPKSAWCRLWHLIERLGRVPGDFRIRLSSLEAAEARDDLVRALSAEPRTVPHLHLCLQSGSDRILALMKRRYRAASFLERCDRLRPRARSARIHDRCHRWLSRRDRRGFSSDLPRCPRGGLYEDSRLLVQSARGNARRELPRRGRSWARRRSTRASPRAGARASR